MHDRILHRIDSCIANDKELTLTEHQYIREQWAAAAEFRPFWVRCIDAEDSPPPLRAGARYQVIGEATMYIDGRPLNKDDERWIVSVGEAGAQEFYKSQFVPEAEYNNWRITRLKAAVASLKAELEEIGEPDGRF